jgi:hypothetical protein
VGSSERDNNLCVRSKCLDEFKEGVILKKDCFMELISCLDGGSVK